MPRLTIELTQAEYDALAGVAVQERRSARDQAAHFVALALTPKAAVSVESYPWQRSISTGVLLPTFGAVQSDE